MEETRKTGIGIRIANIIGAIMFFLFGALQINDIDPEIYHNPSKLDVALWLLFYLFIGVLMLLVIFKKIPTWILIVGIIACVAQMAVTGPGLYQNLLGEESFNMTQEGMSAEDPRVELSREFFGALIAMFGVIWVGVQHRVVGWREENTD